MLDVVADFGLSGNGADDNYARFTAMLADSRSGESASLNWPRGRYKVLMPAGVQTLCELLPGVSWSGVPGLTTLAIYSAADEEKLALRCTQQTTAHATLSGLSLVRCSPWSGALLSLACGSDLSFERCSFDGGGSDASIKPASGAVSGVLYAQDAPGATLKDVTFERCRWTGCDVGLGSPNQGFATVDGLTLLRCVFTGNQGDDITFNSPNQTVEQETANTVPADRPFLQRRLRVIACDFHGGGGIALGLAHVAGVMVRGCTFAGYARQAIQCEDYAHNIAIEGNHFEGCATAGGGLGAVMLIEAAHDVTLGHNTFDQSRVTIAAGVAPPACILAGPGCAPGQYSQLPDPAPFNVLIACNRGRTGPGAGVVVNLARNVEDYGNLFMP